MKIINLEDYKFKHNMTYINHMPLYHQLEIKDDMYRQLLPYFYNANNMLF